MNVLLNYYRKAKGYFIGHKVIGTVIIFAAVVSAYYSYNYLFGTTTETKYTIAVVEKGTLVTSVSGSGQVSAYNQVDIKPKASGDIVWLDLKPGQTVYAGQALAGIDSTDAKKTVADAELALEEAKLNFDKDYAQAPISYARELETLESEKADLDKKYEDSFNSISNAFLDVPNVITGLYDILYGTGVESWTKSWNIDGYKNMFSGSDYSLISSLVDIAVKDYNLARTAYDKNFADFKILTRYSSEADIEAMLDQTLATVKLMAQSAKSENNLMDTIVDLNEKNNSKANASVTTYKTNLKSYLGTINTHLSSLLTQKNSVSDAKQAIVNSNRDIEIMKINNPTGSNPITLQISLNSIKKKEVELADLKAKLANYTIRSPFDGIIASADIKKGDSVSSGTSIATIVTKQKIAESSFNEVDAAKIKLDQKVTLTFDAIDNLSISGRVSEIDTLGTVSQGVVSYGVKISFDTQDDRIKPGMSTSISIITEVKPDVIIVPSSAIKTQNDVNYVELFDGKSLIGNGATTTAKSQTITSLTAPTQRVVEVGISNDTETEIVSGLAEGEEIVTKTTSSTVKTTTTSSSIKLPGMGGGPGGPM